MVTAPRYLDKDRWLDIADHTLGSRLRALRAAAELSQSSLERISGVPKARLSRYENGHIAPSMPTLERLARALDVPLTAMLGIDDVRTSADPLAAELRMRGITIDSPDRAREIADLIERTLASRPADPVTPDAYAASAPSAADDAIAVVRLDEPQVRTAAVAMESASPMELANAMDPSASMERSSSDML